MSAASLQQALHAAGIVGDVSAIGAVAIVRVRAGADAFTDIEARRRTVALAREHGFRNVAVEVDD